MHLYHHQQRGNLTNTDLRFFFKKMMIKNLVILIIIKILL